MLLPVVGTGARPRYGGVLRVESQATLRAVDPAGSFTGPGEGGLRDAVLPHVFETLATVGTDGVRPALATSWVLEPNGTRWRFALRAGVRLHDGTLLDAMQAASSLQRSVRNATITGDAGVLTIETHGDRPDLPWELAEPRHAIVVRGADGQMLGTGPFRVERLEQRRLALAAHDGYWGGRTFLDGVRVEFGRPLATQLASLETDRADVVTVQPTDVRRLSQRPLRLSASRPLELAALVVEPHLAARNDIALRRALSAAIDRDVVARVLLQGQAAPATALLPAWLSGYPPSIVAARLDRAAAASGIAGLPAARRTLVLRVAPDDAVARAIAERVAVDARGAGLLVTVQAPTGLAPRADLRLIRVPVAATTQERSLAALMDALGSRTLQTVSREPPPGPGTPVEAVARVERALLEPFVIVPLVHLPVLLAAGDRVEVAGGTLLRPAGGWNLADVWLLPDEIVRP